MSRIMAVLSSSVVSRGSNIFCEVICPGDGQELAATKKDSKFIQVLMMGDWG